MSRSCGCPDDYHLADCPILTARWEGPPEPPDPYDMEYRWEEDPDE